MRRWKTLLFAAIPALVLVGGLEAFGRLVVSFDWLGKSRMGLRPLDLKQLGRTVFGEDRVLVPDLYNGYRLRDTDDPASRRPPRIPGAPKRTGEVRILCLGDSVTYGIFLREQEAWPARLQEKAASWAPPGTRIEVYNGAVPGYGPQQCKHLFQSRYVHLQPDIVLWAEEPDFDDTLELPPVLSARQVWWTRFLCRSRFLFLLRLVIHSASSPVGFDLYNAPMKEYGESQHDVMRRFVRRSLESRHISTIGVEYLADMTNASTSAGLQALAGFAPHGYSGGHRAGSPIIGNGGKWKARGLPFVPCLDPFQDYPGGPGPLFLDNLHLTAVGSDFLAGLVSEDLRRRWPEFDRSRKPEGDPRRPESR
jgi:hypothetical protein